MTGYDYESSRYTIRCEINEEFRTMTVRAGETLLYVLREHLGLTGCKPGCNNGDCGACTIWINETPVKSCLMLAVEASGKMITTIEGLRNSKIQQEFAQRQAFQCGYCTSGFIMNCEGLLRAHPNADEALVQQWLESNICRCTSYEEIHEVVKSCFISFRQEKTFSSKL